MTTENDTLAPQPNAQQSSPKTLRQLAHGQARTKGLLLFATGMLASDTVALFAGRAAEKLGMSTFHVPPAIIWTLAAATLLAAKESWDATQGLNRTLDAIPESLPAPETPKTLPPGNPLPALRPQG